MKRSRSVVLTSLMATGGLVVAGCDAQSPAQSGWVNPGADTPPAAVSTADPASAAYATLADCLAANAVSDSECQTAYAKAEADTPRFAQQQSCEEQYGVGQCVPRRDQGGGSFFMPLLTGFVVGQALGNLGGARGYYGDSWRRDREYGYGGAGGYGGRNVPASRDYVTGRRDSYDAPAKVQSRSAVISRGGFGGGGRGYG